VRGSGRATGLPLDEDFGQIFTIRDGAVVRFQWFRDPVDALAEAGVKD
jgi:ketosteroid isomerase-like protein